MGRALDEQGIEVVEADGRIARSETAGIEARAAAVTSASVENS